MKKQNISLFLIMSVITVLIAPSNALSYYTIGQSAQKITQHSGIYMIDFTFGFNNRDVYIPIATQRGLSYPDTSSEDTVGYSFTSGTTTNVSDGTSVGLVLSTLPIENGRYKVPAGTAGHFTLVVILTTDNATSTAPYALQVDKLPFPVVYPDGSKKSFQLNNFELERYITPSLLL